MKIADQTYVAIDCCLTLDSGEEVYRSEEGSPLAFITGSGQIIPGLEKSLMGMAVGESAKITVEPEDGYGEINEELYQEVPRSQFPTEVEIQIGMSFQAQGPHGPFTVVVKEVDGENVKVDLNHPMAGKRLNFEVKVIEVRKPSSKEISQLSGGDGCNCGSDAAGGSQGCGPGCSCG